MPGLFSRRKKRGCTPESPSPARLCAILIHSDITREDLQKKTGLNRRVIDDLLRNDNALMNAISIREAAALARALGLDLPDLVSEDPYEVYRTDQVSFQVVAEVIKSCVATTDITLRDFEDRAGWEVADVVQDPALLWDYTLQALKDICTAAGIDWLNVLPRTGD